MEKVVFPRIEEDSPSDVTKLCYCCQENPSEILLWNDKGAYLAYGSMIKSCFNVEFESANDDVICIDCVDLLQSSMRFKQQVTRAQSNHEIWILFDKDVPDDCPMSPFRIEDPFLSEEPKKEKQKLKLIVKSNPDDLVELKNNKYQCKKCAKFEGNYASVTKHLNTVHYKNKSVITPFEMDTRDLHSRNSGEDMDDNSERQERMESIGGDHSPEEHRRIPPKSLRTRPMNALAALRMKLKTQLIYPCKKCSMKFKTMDHLINHQRTHRPRARAKQSSESKTKDEGEKKTEKRKPPPLLTSDYTQVHQHCLICKHCDRVFKRKEDMMRHVNVKHRGILTVYCDVCDEGFNTNIRLNKHKTEIHNIDLRRICNACDKFFYTDWMLKCHMMKFHKLGPQKKCPYCDFVTFNHLGKHMITHEEGRRYKCEKCSKEFRSDKNYKDHLNWHAGIKNRVCKLCGERFLRWNSLDYHIKKCHPNNIDEAKGRVPINTSKKTEASFNEMCNMDREC